MIIHNTDCVVGMKKYIRDSLVDLIVTSPPYKKEDGFGWDTMKNVARECYRVLKNDSLCYINFGHLANYKSRPFKVAIEFEKAGFIWIDTIVWVKNHYTPIQGRKRVNSLTEFIFMFSKGKNYKLNRLSIGIPYKDKSNIGRYSDIDLKCRGNCWHIPYETIQSKKQKPHKDRFPIELPLNCIKLSNVKNGSIVLDPFAGSMTTCLACENLGMRFIGFELNSKVFEAGKNRLKNYNRL